METGRLSARSAVDVPSGWDPRSVSLFKAVDQVLPLLLDSREEVSLAAVKILQDLAMSLSEQHVQHLGALLQNGSSRARLRAMEALSRQGDAVLEFMIEAPSDTCYEVTSCAAWWLKGRGWQPSTEEQSVAFAIGWQDSGTVKALGKASVPKLTRVQNSSYTERAYR